MAAFPRLKTGAISQYPLTRNAQFGTEVIRFGDGSEQRYRDLKSGLRGWRIRLELLTESEMAMIESFYWANGGAAGAFEFTDPFDGAAYSSCEFEGAVELVFEGQGRGGSEIVLRERR